MKMSKEIFYIIIRQLVVDAGEREKYIRKHEDFLFLLQYGLFSSTFLFVEWF